MARKICKLVGTMLISIILFSCGRINVETNVLTVTNIHDKVVRGQTSKKELIKLFGEADEKIEGTSKVEKLYRSYTNREGTLFDLLDDNTDYYTTEKYVQTTANDDWTYDSCYIYHGKDLGLEYVRFYFKEGVVEYYHFGDINNEKVAKKDKYLRQIID